LRLPDRFSAADENVVSLLNATISVSLSEDRKRMDQSLLDITADLRASRKRFIELGTSIKTARAKLFTGGDELTAQLENLVGLLRAANDSNLSRAASDLEGAALLTRVANWRSLATADANGPATFRKRSDEAVGVIEQFEKLQAGGHTSALSAVKASLNQYASSFGAIS
jgi:hypothetical protein